MLHVRNTLAAAASEGARWAATADQRPVDGAARTRAMVGQILAGRYAQHVTARAAAVEEPLGVVVRVEAEVPPLGLFGPARSGQRRGHAVEEQPP